MTGGKSRKTGGVSKALIARLKTGNYQPPGIRRPKKLTKQDQEKIDRKVEHLNQIYSNIEGRNADIVLKMRTSLEEAIEAGGILIQLKKEAGHGNWIPLFKKKKLNFSIATAQNYMNTHKTQVQEPEKFLNVRNLSQAYGIINTKKEQAQLPQSTEEEEETEAPAISENQRQLKTLFEKLPRKGGWVLGRVQNEDKNNSRFVLVENHNDVVYYSIFDEPIHEDSSEGIDTFIQELNKNPELAQLKIKWEVPKKR